MNKRFWIFKAIKIAIMVTIFINVIGFGTMYLWNWLMPFLFKLPAITFLQALGLLLLSKIVFGFGRGGGGRFGDRRRWQRRMQEKFENMSPEEKEKFRAKMQGRCGDKFRGFEQRMNTANDSENVIVAE
ncbi:MAG: hypothetical protein U0U67_12750 [Chitinophagales bacterium]